MIGSKMLFAYRKHLINVRLENVVASSFGRGYSFRRCNIQNKENGTYRPTFFCMRDEKHPFFG